MTASHEHELTLTRLIDVHDFRYGIIFCSTKIMVESRTNNTKPNCQRCVRNFAALGIGTLVIKMRGIFLVESQSVRVGRSHKHPTVTRGLNEQRGRRLEGILGTIFLFGPPLAVNRTVKRFEQNI